MTVPTPLRTAATSSEAERQRAQKDAQAALAAKLKATLKPDLTAHEQRIIEAITKNATEGMFDQGKRHGIELGVAKGERIRVWYTLAVALAAFGAGILATTFTYERGVWFGGLTERMSAGNAELKAMEDQQ